MSAFVESGNESVLTHGAGLARWHSAAEGEVEFTDLGWETANVVQFGGAEVLSPESWVYTFTSNVTGVFTLNYSVTTGGSDPLGLGGIYFVWSEPDGFVRLELTSHGTFTMPLVQGQTYTVKIRSLANIFGALGTRTASMTGKFAWRIH